MSSDIQIKDINKLYISKKTYNARLAMMNTDLDLN